MDAHHLHIVLNTLDFWALFGCMGLLISRAWLLPPAAFKMQGVARRWHRMLGLSLSVLTATGLSLLLVRTMEMGDIPFLETLSILPSVLVQTHFGRIWGLHLICLPVLWICWIMSLRSPTRTWPACMLALIVLLAFTYSASSHSADLGDFTSAELMDWLHILSASTWGGGILASAVFIFPALKNQSGQHWLLVSDMVGRLSVLSALALAIVLITGLYNAMSRLGSFDALTNNFYGRILGIKLILVIVMIVIAAANRFFLFPNIQQWAAKPVGADDRPLRWIKATVWMDAVLVLLIMTAAAVLIQSMPPVAMT